MRTKGVLLAATTLLLGGCDYVKRAEFEAHRSEFEAVRDSVIASGNAVDEWIAAAHAYLWWLNDQIGKTIVCPECDPPEPPPTPPPDGGWGEQ